MLKAILVGVGLAFASLPSAAQVTCLNLGGGITSCSNGQTIKNLGEGIAVDNSGNSAIVHAISFDPQTRAYRAAAR